ncbi:MAG TPA: DEAD/DEAH box helicase [Anaerolineales bacterium]|nr:DEAD/DEAH box helicase [Anaerolineales bacterium]
MTSPTDTDSDLVEPENKLPSTSIPDLPPRLRTAVERAGWTELTPVQKMGIPYILAGRDMMVQARTGSGKTGAFVLPLLEQIDVNLAECQAIVLAPTRELAKQVAEEAALLAGPDGPRVTAVYGGAAYGPQIEDFKKGAHIVVGTPGRILDHLIKRTLKLDDLRFFIFDEADRMLSMGFYPDMIRIRAFLPKDQLVGLMFSATFPAHVVGLARQFLTDPNFLSLSKDRVHVEDTDHVFYVVPRMDKDRALVSVIEFENPSQCIIFCNTKDQVFYVSSVLQRFGHNADQLSSDLSQDLREKVMDRFRKGKLRFLVATDVAARGIDIPEMSHVIQYEPPEELEVYIHRAGRTGRAGLRGRAVMLVDVLERREITRIGARYNIEFEELPLPDEEAMAELVSERLIIHLEAQLRDRDKLQVERMARFLPVVAELAADDDTRALLAMVLDDLYHLVQNQPPELPPIGTQVEPRPAQRRGGGRGRRRGGGRR